MVPPPPLTAATTQWGTFRCKNSQSQPQASFLDTRLNECRRSHHNHCCCCILHSRHTTELPCRRLRHSTHTSHVTRHTSHVTRHTSHATRHTSHVTRHTSHVTRHTSHVTRHTSHVTRHTSHVTRHKFHVSRHTSHASVRPANSCNNVRDGRGALVAVTALRPIVSQAEQRPPIACDV
jgi:hypothetical protein